jgi:hypothetical protein
MLKIQNKRKSSCFSLSFSLIVSLFAALANWPVDTIAQETQITKQQNNEKFWYKVEVCIFENTPSDTQNIEQWPRDIELSYPAPLVTLNAPPSETPIAEEHTSTANNPSVTDSSNQLQKVNPTVELQAFTLMASSQRDLNSAVARIERNPSMKILFHESWVQPIDEQNKAMNIALHGGRSYDDHFELEGSIRLSRERYLHIETNLWLNRFTINMGQEIEPWPILPALPYSPIHAETTGFSASADTVETLEQNDFNKTAESAGFKLNDLQEFGSQFHAFLEKRYVTDRVVSMRQHRKMRSSELHYLDHPLLGLLIQITPYEPPAKEALADSEDQNPATETQSGQ